MATQKTLTTARQVRLRDRIWAARWMYVFAVPGFLYFVVFHYVPLLGNVVAFQEYSPYLGFEGSPWVGLDNFTAMFNDPAILNALVNTLIISALQIFFAFPAPILLALLLNSLMSERWKRFVQSVVYLPHFLSWVIVISVWQSVLGGTGGLSGLFQQLGVQGSVMANPDTFKILLTAQVIWKDIGWGTIIFLAAITAIGTELYEAAAVDGANAWRRALHVTLPGLLPVIVLLLILRLGSVLSVGFEQIILQLPAVGAGAADVLDTFVYFRGVVGGDWGLATAAGLLKGVIGTAMVIGANHLAHKLGQDGLF